MSADDYFTTYYLVGNLNSPWVLMTVFTELEYCLEAMQHQTGYEVKVLGSLDIQSGDQEELFLEIVSLNYGTVEHCMRLINNGSLWDLFQISITDVERSYLNARCLNYAQFFDGRLSPHRHRGFPQAEVPYWYKGILFPVLFALPWTEMEDEEEKEEAII